MTAQAPAVAILEAARAAYGAGLSVLPVKADGTKKPVVAWGRYQRQRAAWPQVESWFGVDGRGLGVVTGFDGLEMLELEGRAVDGGLAERFRIATDAAGLGPLLDRILSGYCERTPSGGLHLLYREPTPLGSMKLASRPATPEELADRPGDSEKVLIETRGAGGYVVTAPSNGKVHRSGKPWALVTGGFETIATITDEERDVLFDVARLFDEMPPPEVRDTQPAGPKGDRPGDLYDAHPDAPARTLALLEQHGWKVVYTDRKGVVHLRRPGKDDEGTSATLGYVAPGIFHVFSTAAAPFEAKRAYSPWQVYAILEHGGDWSAAARALSEAQGFTFTRSEDDAAGDDEAPGDGLATPRPPTGALPLSAIPAMAAQPRRFGRWVEGAGNVMFGPGGVGKGLVLAWDIGRLVADGERVLLVDYEDHPDEWSRRIGSLAGGQARSVVLHVAPLDPERWKGRTGPLWDIAPRLRAEADDFGATWVVVDSIGPACYGADFARDANVPTQYRLALSIIGRTSISIGQVNRAGDLSVPFGSIHWHYQVRGSWSVETAPGGIRGSNILLTDRKANNHATAERAQLDVTWWEDLPRGIVERPYRLALGDRIEAVLSGGPLPAAEITSELNAEAESDRDKVSAAVVRETLRRGCEEWPRTPRRFTVTGTGKKALYGNA